MSWGVRAVALLAAAVIAACTWNSLAWLNRPFPGFFLWENLFVPAVGDTDWTGYRADVPFPTRLATMNGRPVANAAEVYTFAASQPVGTPVTYTFSMGTGVATVAREVPTMRLTMPEYLWTLGNYLGTGILLTLLGFVVYLLRPDTPAARAMLVAGSVFGLYFTTAADIFGPAWFRPLCLILQFMTPVAELHVAFTFPFERQIVRTHPRLIALLYGIAAAVGVIANIFFTRWFDGLLAMNLGHAFASAAAGAVLIAMLAHSFFRPPSAAARQRTKIAALGAGASFLLPIAGVAVFAVLGAHFPLNLVTMPLALFPVAIGYAIVQHDLFEVDAIIRRSVSWAILTAVIAAVYLGGVGLFDLLFTGRSGRAAQLLFLIAIVAVFNPLRNRVQAAVDFLFARDRYDYRAAVGAASQALTSLLDLETIVQRILRTIAETMHVDLGAVWLRGDGDGYRLEAVAGSRAGAALPARLDRGNPLIQVLENDPQLLVSEDDGDAGAESALAAQLGRLGATLIVPMAFEHRLIGVLALGGKESGAFYSREDLGLLRTLANQGAVAVENAHSYLALVRANEELRAAQSRLIEAERFAAIGEISAAVAHGIRNPVAGIKAAAQLAGLEIEGDHPLRENITDIITETDKLEARIKTLLDFAKPFEPHPSSCRVDAIVQHAAASLRPQMTAHGITFTADIDAELPEIQVDFAQVEQVVLVLVSNAIEAMVHGGAISVSARRSNAHVRLEVRDNGPGISPDQLQRVFRLFFTTKSSGTGLGLPVAKKIVERHGGTITVASELGRGTTFTVELPLTCPGDVEGAVEDGAVDAKRQP